ncbi:MAG: metal ABC transporter substrate-binding protein [Acetobacteraceae bacterium]
MITYLSRRALFAALLLPFAARAQPAKLPARLKVVATMPILADFVRQVGGEAVETVSLVPPNGDPHAFQPRPGDLNSLRGAAVVVENGLGLEGWMGRLVQSSGFRGARIVATAGITPRSLQEGGRVVADPHVWQDPSLAVKMVGAIADGLVKADPANAAAYRGRAGAYVTSLRQQDAEIAKRFATVPPGKRLIVITHDAFSYYGARYGIQFRAPLGISTEAEPSPRALARLAGDVRRQGLKTVFLENMSDPRIAEALAREAGAAVGAKLYADSLSPPDGPAPTYLDMLRYNTEQFAAAMGG